MISPNKNVERKKFYPKKEQKVEHFAYNKFRYLER
jgi:hypothetical protein